MSTTLLWGEINDAIVELFTEAKALLAWAGNVSEVRAPLLQCVAEEVPECSLASSSSSSSSALELPVTKLCEHVALTLLQFRDRVARIAAEQSLTLTPELAFAFARPSLSAPQDMVTSAPHAAIPADTTNRRNFEAKSSTLYHLLHIDPPSQTIASSGLADHDGHGNDVRHWIDEAQHVGGTGSGSTPLGDPDSEEMYAAQLVGGQRRETIAPKGSAASLATCRTACSGVAESISAPNVVIDNEEQHVATGERKESITSENSDANIEAAHVIISALRKSHVGKDSGDVIPPPDIALQPRAHRHSSVAFVNSSESQLRTEDEVQNRHLAAVGMEPHQEDCSAEPLVLEIPLEEVQDVRLSVHSPCEVFAKSGTKSSVSHSTQRRDTGSEEEALRRLSTPFGEINSPLSSTVGILREFVDRRNIVKQQHIGASPWTKRGQANSSLSAEPASPSFVSDVQRRSLLGVEENGGDRRGQSVTSFSRGIHQRKGSGGTSYSFGYVEDDDVSLQGRTPALQELTVVTNHVSRGFDEFGAKMLNDDYVFLQDLGSGSSGKVKLAFQPSKNRLVAVKIVRRDASAGRKNAAGAALGRVAEVRLQNLDREIRVMMKLRHNHLVALYEVIDDPDAAKLYMVMQYIDEGQLATPIPGTDGLSYAPVLQLDDAIRFMRQICKGLDYLHSQGMAHHDIKPENVLRSGSDQVYLADFGLCSDVHDIDSQHFGGTILFMAPELVSKRRNHVSKMSISARECGVTGGEGLPEEAELDPVALDIWALGITFLVLLSGSVPFSSEEEICEASDREIRLVTDNVIHRAASAYLNHQPVTSPVENAVASPHRRVDQEMLVALTRAMCHIDPKHRPAARKVKAALKHCIT